MEVDLSKKDDKIEFEVALKILYSLLQNSSDGMMSIGENEAIYMSYKIANDFINYKKGGYNGSNF